MTIKVACAPTSRFATPPTGTNADLDGGPAGFGPFPSCDIYLTEESGIHHHVSFLCILGNSWLCHISFSGQLWSYSLLCFVGWSIHWYRQMVRSYQGIWFHHPRWRIRRCLCPSNCHSCPRISFSRGKSEGNQRIDPMLLVCWYTDAIWLESIHAFSYSFVLLGRRSRRVFNTQDRRRQNQGKQCDRSHGRLCAGCSATTSFLQ